MEPTEKIIVPYWFTKNYIESMAGKAFFIYGCNALCPTYFGQEAVGGYYAHCVGIPVRWKNCKNSDALFHDIQLDAVKKEMDGAFEQLKKINVDKLPVIPFRKLGEGCAQMPGRAPAVWSYLQEQIAAHCVPVEYNYKARIL